VYYATIGVAANGFRAAVLLGNMTITGNAKGVAAMTKGSLGSYKNNSITDNGNDGTPISPAPLN